MSSHPHRSIRKRARRSPVTRAGVPALRGDSVGRLGMMSLANAERRRRATDRRCSPPEQILNDASLSTAERRCLLECLLVHDARSRGPERRSSRPPSDAACRRSAEIPAPA